MSIQQEHLVAAADDGVLPGIDDQGAMSAWILAEVADAVGPLRFGLIAAGGSNLTYRVDDSAGSSWILRRPPLGQLLESAHNVLRECRIMTALEGSTVPVPRCLAVGSAEQFGAPFCLFSYEVGWIFRDTATAVGAGAAGCATSAENMFDSLADLHLLDPATIGLGDLSRPDAYVPRQLRRWKRQYDETSQGDPIALGLDLWHHLEAAAPADFARPSGYLLHGDYHIDNLIFDDTFGVRAALDWELSTLGHPIADLAWALIFWAEAGEPPLMSMEQVTAAPGFPSRDALAQRYAARSGFDLSSLPYFMAFSYWKLGCLVQASAFRSQHGSGGGLQQGSTFDAEASRRRVESLFEMSATAAAQGFAG